MATVVDGLLMGLGVALLSTLAVSRGGAEENLPANAAPADAGATAPVAAPSTPLELEVEAPASGERVRLLVPLAEVRGRAGRATFSASDVVVAVDASTSSLLASGLDVDGDGSAGRSRGWAEETGRFPKPSRSWTTDPDDTVLSAEILVARLMIQGLGARDNRLGVLSFSSRPTVRAPVGPPAAALAALAGIEGVDDREGTDLARALRSASTLLRAASASGAGDRPREILLFSDGEPSVPHGEHWAARRAIQVARELAEEGVRVWTIAFGTSPDREYLDELARAGGGERIALEQLGPLLDEPGLTTLRPEELSIENLTTGQKARALRTFRDGRFDAYVPLVEGDNLLQVEAVLADGQRTRERLRVRYERPAEETEADRLEAARLLVELRRRSTEIERTQ
jgi:hypothetical protein